MPAEVLVMCGECGRPQPAGPKCVACGAALPPVLDGSPGRAAPRDGLAPPLEAELGQGRVVALSRQRLEWRPGPGGMPLACELSALEGVELRHRPLYEALLLVAFAIVAMPLLPLWARVPLAVLGALGVLACSSARRYALRLRLKGGARQDVPLGISRRGAPLEQRIASGWGSLAPALRARGLAAAGEVGR